MKRTTPVRFLYLLLVSLFGISLTSCDGMLLSTGVSVDPSDYYYDGWPGDYYGSVTLPVGWSPSWGGVGWYPGPAYGHPWHPGSPGYGPSVPSRPFNPNGPQHYIPPMAPTVGPSNNSGGGGSGLTGQRPGAGRH